MNSVVFHFSTACGILLFFDAVLRYLATFSCGIAVLGPPRSTPQIALRVLVCLCLSGNYVRTLIDF